MNISLKNHELVKIITSSNLLEAIIGVFKLIIYFFLNMSLVTGLILMHEALPQA